MTNTVAIFLSLLAGAASQSDPELHQALAVSDEYIGCLYDTYNQYAAAGGTASDLITATFGHCREIEDRLRKAEWLALTQSADPTDSESRADRVVDDDKETFRESIMEALVEKRADETRH